VNRARCELTRAAHLEVPTERRVIPPLVTLFDIDGRDGVATCGEHGGCHTRIRGRRRVSTRARRRVGQSARRHEPGPGIGPVTT